MEQQNDSMIGPAITGIVEKLLHGYFKERYKFVPIKKPSMYMDFFTFAYYLNDEVLTYIFDENTDIMDVDWRDLFILKSDFTDIDEDRLL